MKKMCTLLVMLLVVMATQAQDWSFGGDSFESKRNNFGLDLGVGGTGGITVDLGFKWQTNFNEFISWDVIALRAISNVEEDVIDTLTPQLMTGPRLYSPEMAGLRLYLNANAGYAHNFDVSDGGFAFEVGTGIRVSRCISIGYAYNQFKIGEAKVKYHAFRLGFLF